MAVFLDSSVLIACSISSDELHPKAVQLMRSIDGGEYGSVFCCDYVFDETITYILRKTNDRKKAEAFGNWLLGAQITLLYTNRDRFNSAWELFKKTRGLSFTDCVIAATCISEGIAHLATFDSGFRQITSIRLLE
ncbi:type II toxin-antitoxin system VapC family toxin [Candidatus Micrarchaeota archaeon]|nr:type II toxin-antitoxin system VapC family toxin [Candidatus Micrarchaeota archaeon]